MDLSWLTRHRRPIIMLGTSLVLFAVSISVAFSDTLGTPTEDRAVRTVSDRPLRIMPLGDSITEGQTVPGSYRIELAKLLTADHRMFDFVGSQSNGPPDLVDHDHEGHPGWCLAVCTENLHDHLYEWLAVTQPDVILLHAGTNDLGQGASYAETTDRLRLVVDDIYKVDPDVHVYIAKIRYGITYNDGVVQVAAAERAQGHFAEVVDLDDSGGFGDYDYVDGVHPNAQGAAKMGRAWYAAMKEHGF